MSKSRPRLPNGFKLVFGDAVYRAELTGETSLPALPTEVKIHFADGSPFNPDIIYVARLTDPEQGLYTVEDLMGQGGRQSVEPTRRKGIRWSPEVLDKAYAALEKEKGREPTVREFAARYSGGLDFIRNGGVHAAVCTFNGYKAYRAKQNDSAEVKPEPKKARKVRKPQIFERTQIVRPVGEELIIELPGPTKKGLRNPSWKKLRTVPLYRNLATYVKCEEEPRNPAEWFGGYENEVEVEIGAGAGGPYKIRTKPTGAISGTKKGDPAGNMLSATIKPFFANHPDLQPGDKIHFRRTAENGYTMWVDELEPVQAGEETSGQKIEPVDAHDQVNGKSEESEPKNNGVAPPTDIPETPGPKKEVNTVYIQLGDQPKPDGNKDESGQNTPKNLFKA